MTRNPHQDIETTVCWLIADTFYTAPHSITLSTRPDDIEGWDQAGHAVLMTRIARRLGVPLTDGLAGPIIDVGGLIRRLSQNAALDSNE